ncbi:hypothetical protein AU14_17305 [Marinobacter similis]|uniref:DUF4402 domain-containing protein n=2 Tax=Marinobacter similis TaxID=1420916 RepID=W5YKX0_9GAMM|nr:hypothetical protein AU14_17305 [Marinobacter similis]
MSPVSRTLREGAFYDSGRPFYQMEDSYKSNRCSDYLAVMILGASLAFAPSLFALDLTVTRTQDLAFGSFAAVNGGSITIGNFGSRTSTGSIWLNPSAGGTSALFSLAGDPDSTFAVMLPANGTVFLTGPGSPMPVSNFTSNPAGVDGRLDILGTGVVRVGATLGVSSGQIPGAYSGNFFITVNYN